MPAGFYRSKLVLLAETFIFTVLPLLILKQWSGLLAYRYYLMAGGLIYVGQFFKSEKIKLKDLGFLPKNFYRGFKENLRFALLAILVTLGLYVILPMRWVLPIGVDGLVLGPAWWCAVMYLVISVPLQEILYRSYLLNRSERVLPRPLAVVYAAVIFMLIHTPFTTPVMTLGALILGWYWAANFLRYRNFYAIATSHVLVGFVYFALYYFRP